MKERAAPSSSIGELLLIMWPLRRATAAGSRCTIYISQLRVFEPEKDFSAPSRELRRLRGLAAATDASSARYSPSRHRLEITLFAPPCTKPRAHAMPLSRKYVIGGGRQCRPRGASRSLKVPPSRTAIYSIPASSRRIERHLSASPRATPRHAHSSTPSPPSPPPSPPSFSSSSSSSASNSAGVRSCLESILSAASGGRCAGRAGPPTFASFIRKAAVLYFLRYLSSGLQSRLAVRAVCPLA